MGTHRGEITHFSLEYPSRALQAEAWILKQTFWENVFKEGLITLGVILG